MFDMQVAFISCAHFLGIAESDPDPDLHHSKTKTCIMWKLHNKTALFIVYIAESEKIKKTFAFNVDIFNNWETEKIILQSISECANLSLEHIFLITYCKAIHFSWYQKIYALNSEHYN